MPDVKAIRYLLANNANLIAVVPAAKIMADEIPINTLLPAILVSHISGKSRNIVPMNAANAIVTARVQVTVKTSRQTSAQPYVDAKNILALVKKAVPNVVGSVNGVQVSGILSDMEGPDLRSDDDEIRMLTQDFIIKYLEPTS